MEFDPEIATAARVDAITQHATPAVADGEAAGRAVEIQRKVRQHGDRSGAVDVMTIRVALARVKHRCNADRQCARPTTSPDIAVLPPSEPQSR